jgi:hypothetical protein
LKQSLIKQLPSDHDGDRAESEAVSGIPVIMHDGKLRRFDYAAVIYGFIGTLLTLGVFGDMPKGILYFWGLFSAFLCLPSIAALIVNLFIESFDRSDRRAFWCYAVANIVPAIAFFRLANPSVAV